MRFAWISEQAQLFLHTAIAYRFL